MGGRPAERFEGERRPVVADDGGPRNVAESFAAVCARAPGRTAVEVQRPDRVEAFTYAELDGMAARISARLLASGCAKGDRVALIADNGARWCAAFFGVQRIGAVAVPLDTSYKPAQIGTLLADSGARAVLAGPRYSGAVREAIAGHEVEAGPEAVVSDEAVAGQEAVTGREAVPGRESTIEAISLDEAMAGPPARDLPPCPATRQDPAVILYTSGTTADPKGVVLTHGNLLAECEAAFRVVRVDEHDVALSVLPLFHALALFANLLLPLSAGGRVVFLESVNTGELLRALRERDVTAFVCVPQFFYLLHERIFREAAAAGLVKRSIFRLLLAANGASRRFLRVNLGPLLFRPVHRVMGRRMRLLLTGGSRFDPAIARDLVRLGFDLRQAYGLTECSGAATLTRAGALSEDGVGPPLPGVEVRVLSPEPVVEGSAAGPDGEIVIRGPIVMAGYHDKPEANAATLRGGWLHTGDLGFVDERGRVHVTGRRKEVIVLASGKNIYPEEIEAHYLQSPFIREMCVMGLSRPGEPISERLHAVVVPDSDRMRERGIVNVGEQLRFEIEGLSAQLPNMKRILSYDVETEPLARTTTRKLKRFEIRNRIAARHTEPSAALVAPGTPVTPLTPVAPAQGEDATWLAEPGVRRVLDLLAGALRPGTSLAAKANLELDLGLDSMERVELLTGAEQELGVCVPEEISRTIFTIRDLVEALRTAPPAAARSSVTPWDALLDEDGADVDAGLAELDRPRPVTTLLLYLIVRAGYLWGRGMWRFRIAGLDHLPARGPFILSPNHQSYLDAFLLVGALPYRVFRQVFFVGASEYFATPARRRLARLVNVVPVDPDANLVRAMKAGAYGLRRGKVLILFPEGERSIDGAVKKFKKGAAILSLHLGVPIVPVALDGIFDLWPRDRSPRWRAVFPGSGVRVSMRLGAALDPEDVPREPAGRASSVLAAAELRYEAVTERLRACVLEMWEGIRALRTTARAGPDAR